MSNPQAVPVDNGNVAAPPAEEKVWTPLERNSRLGAILCLISQAATIALYAIFVRPQAYTSVIDNGLFEAVGVALLVLIGTNKDM